MDVKSIKILGLDPGFANLGYAIVEVGSWGSKVLDLGVFRTEKSDKKRAVLAADDNVRRGRLIAAHLNQLIGKWRVHAICAEAMSFPRSSSAAAKMAISWGCIATLLEVHNLCLVQASPQEIKKKLCERKDASKEDVEAAVKKIYGQIDSHLEGNVPPSSREHAYDALAAIVTGLDSEVLRAVRSLVA